MHENEICFSSPRFHAHVTSGELAARVNMAHPTVEYDAQACMRPAVEYRSVVMENGRLVVAGSLRTDNRVEANGGLPF